MSDAKRSGVAASALAVVGLGACGARSQLSDAGAVGAGGAGATASSGEVAGAAPGASSSGSGGGSGTPLCVLMVTGQDTVAPGSAAANAARPALVALGLAAPPVALLEAFDPVETTDPPRSSLAVVGLDPWGAWPPAMSPLVIATTTYASRYAVAPSTDGHFALLVDTAPAGGEGGGLAFAVDATPQAPPTLVQATLEHNVPAFIDTSFPAVTPADYGYWIEDPSGGVYLYVEASAEAGEGYACGPEPLPAVALHTGDRVLAAIATQDLDNVCEMLPPPEPSALVGVHVIRPGMDPWIYDIAYITLHGRALDLAMAPRSDGAWVVVVVGTSPALGGQTRLRISNMDGEADFAGHLPSKTTAAIAAAPFGDGLFLVTLDAATSALDVHLFDASATPIGELAVPLAFPDQPVAPLAAIAGPSGREWLVAWPAVSGTGSDAPNAVHVARIACADPPPP